MSYVLDFELAGLPSTANSHRSHWVAGANRKKWRKAVELRTFMQRPPSPLSSCRITCTRFSSSEPDYDNLVQSFKPVIDGLKDGGIIQDDKSSVVKERKYLWEKAKAKAGRIKVLVEEVAA